MHWIALQPQPEPASLGADSAKPLSDPLGALVWWALQLTPKVVRLPDAVLLEVSVVERLWGGKTALLRHIYESNKPVALVEYAQGATSLIAYGRLLAATSPGTAADDLPLTALTAAAPHLDTLARIGCTRWGQLRALPRGGVSRRFGAALLAALDQAYGTSPDVYPWQVLPEVFDARLALNAQVENAPALLFGARRLLAQLQLWLQWRQRGVLAIELGWDMDARRNTETSGALVLRTAEPMSEMAHLQRLLGERLALVSLPAPVLSLRLRSLETQALTGRSTSLLPDDNLPGDSLQQTLERLSARLGPDKVLRLQAFADHRPEQMQAWVAVVKTPESVAACPGTKRAGGLKSIKNTGILTSAAAAPGSDWASALYPTWLLPVPLKLAVHQQRPHYHGPLTLLAGPQRLESGWWPVRPELAGGAGQGALALRDYFVARGANATLLWVYRERLGSADPAQPASAWYLQGVFA